MMLKPRTRLVITFSSLIIASVLALTIFGFSAYLKWKKTEMRRNYKLGLYDLNAQLFEKHINVKLEAKNAGAGIFREKPVIIGTIKNTSNKKIYSLKLKIFFYDSKERVIYVDSFYPVGLEFESLLKIGHATENFLREGDSLSFEHQLKNCPPRLLDYLESKLNFAKLAHVEPLELKYKLEGIDIR